MFEEPVSNLSIESQFSYGMFARLVKEAPREQLEEVALNLYLNQLRTRELFKGWVKDPHPAKAKALLDQGGDCVREN